MSCAVFNRSSLYFSQWRTTWEFCVQTRSTKKVLLLVIILPQAPQFSLVQSDVMVDLEVVHPVVLAVWVDLKGRGQGQSFREEAD